jgi:hypothetical protein
VSSEAREINAAEGSKEIFAGSSEVKERYDKQGQKIEKKFAKRE